MENITNNVESEILTRLKEDGYVNADNSLNVENLMGRRMQTGNGSIADGDVYVLEQREEKIQYFGDQKIQRNPPPN